jgi:thiamine-phosphate pyrophosphorylase
LYFFGYICREFSDLSHSQTAIRILDASLNRASEGLRVVEDYVRFALDDRHLTELLKSLRHDLTAASAALPLPDRHAARDTAHDVGTNVTTAAENRRANALDVCSASLERLKQSLRSLEEYAKIASPQTAAAFESLRYRLYTIEAAIGRTVDANERLANVRLYVLVDGGPSESAFRELVTQAIAGGADAIQLRDKGLSDRDLISRAHLLRELTLQPQALPGGGTMVENASHHDPRAKPGAAARPLLIINDRPDVAAIANADGVHLGQDDMTVKDARSVIGPRKLIGVSTHSIEQARAAVLDGANYIGAGPTFPSRTKEFHEFTGVELLKQIAAEIRLPAFAIGGVGAENVGQVVAAGFRRIAVSAAIVDAANPQAAASELLSALTS